MARRIVITGAAGLVGQNLIARLAPRTELELVGIDKHPANTALLRRLHPGMEVIEADLAQRGDWEACFAGAEAVVVNQAQIGGLERAEFVANNITATENVLAAARAAGVPYMVGISSSVVNSRARDLYVETKTAQEQLFLASGIPCAILRPTLMFGWFDRKHLGWLRRFMDRTPVFPIPGRGDYRRQPLYAGDFCAVIEGCLARRMGGTHDISGLETITYGALIQMIHDIVKPRARILHIPYGLFWALLWTYGRFDRNPPFTVKQLEALVIPEVFPVIDWPGIFGVTSTPLRDALAQTFTDPRYRDVVLEF
ncbi:MAG: NAD(P)-dependent oxidoreductase [Rubritepida sp.]|nr:NAD(P)-dependent oxidoreductase [Rubritepida sp.]